MIKLCLITLFLLASVPSFAATDSMVQAKDLQNRKALTITDVKIHEIETVEALPMFLPTLNPIGDVIMVIDSLLALGQKIWPIIEQGRPVVTTKLAPAVSVIPNIEGTNVVLNQMENWSLPKMVSYRISFNNALDMEVIGFTYTIFYQYNGTYNSKGRYITNLKVQASNIYASWGSNFDASSELIGISNVGTLQDPLASAIIQVSYVAKGVFNQNSGARSFYVDGAGNISPIND
ncbi:MAG: hypothetical protein PHY93_11410 [Bacteriovorax sp.]|nr:hypothetical protein [Bacteriovorax sp.]